jgi:uncharacterized protein YqgQ
MEALFWKRSDEFQMLQRHISNLPDASNLPLYRLSTLHKEYNRLYQTGFVKREDFSSSAYQEHDRLIRTKQEELFELLKGIS